MRNIIIFGVPVNIGQQALQIIEANPNDFEVMAVSIHHNVIAFTKILQKHQIIKIVHLSDATQEADLVAQYPTISFVTGERGINDMLAAFPMALVLNAISSFAGLYPTFKKLF